MDNEQMRGKLRDAELALKKAMLAIEAAIMYFDMMNGPDDDSAPSFFRHQPVPIPAPEPVKVEAAPQEPLIINDEWTKVLDLLNNGIEHVFITGEAGTGKSTLLNHFANNYAGNCAIVAPTGRAAILVGGATIHSFFGWRVDTDADDIQALSDSQSVMYRTLDILIIDEVSMVRADRMDMIDIFLRKNGRDKTKPFGGCRLVMFGDLFQLSPVVTDKEEKRWLVQRYGTDLPYFFHAACWRETPLKICELTTIFRQKDPTYTSALNAIRKGTVTPEHMALINSRVQPGFRPSANELWITLTTTNASADQANQAMLRGLTTPSKFFDAVISDNFNLKDAPTDVQLELKPGCVVMFIRNGAKARGEPWVNGTMGKVVSTDPLRIEVEGRTYEVDRVVWESIAYAFDEKTRKLTRTVKGEFEQVPLKLAAAITIHKGQGMSFDNVVVDLGFGAFAAGQTYVSLSRARTLQGMVLRRPVQMTDLITSTEVRAFMSGQSIAKPTPAQPLLMEVPHE